MHTEMYCESPNKLDRIKAIRAIHEAYLQLSALTANIDCGHYNNRQALESLADCLRQAGFQGL